MTDKMPELLPCPFDKCGGTMKYEEDDYNCGYLCPDCEGWVMPCLKPLNRAPQASINVPEGLEEAIEWMQALHGPKDERLEPHYSKVQKVIEAARELLRIKGMK